MIKFIIDNSTWHQWDFKVYYIAAEAQRAGLNPYDTNVLSSIGGEELQHNYLYPPLTLWFFRLFTLLGYNQAFFAFLFLKAFLFIFIVLLWRKIFIGQLGPFYYLFCLLSFKSVVYIDLRAGNVAIIELFFLMTGLLAYLRKKYALFSILICAAGVFKLTPALLLVLLLFTNDRKRHLYLVAFSSLFVIVELVFFYQQPSALQSFINNIMSSGERGSDNPALLPIIQDFVSFVCGQLGLTQSGLLVYALYGLMVITILVASALTITKSSKRNIDYLFVSMFVITTYLTVMPRVKDYSYVLAVFPSLYIITLYWKRSALVPLCFIFVIADSTLVSFQSSFLSVFWLYYPYFLISAAWLMYVMFVFDPKPDHD